jgi:nitroreductase
MPIERFPERPAVSVSPEEIRVLLLSRRSVRAFEDRPVPDELINRLIEVGTYAGTASNAQTEGFVIVQDKGVLADVETAVTEVLWRKIKPLGSGIGRMAARMKYGAELVRQSMSYYERFSRRRTEGRLRGTIFRNAPAVVVVHGLRSNPNASANCAIAVRNMEIMAESLGLGTCWAGFLLVAAGFDKGLAKRLSIPDDRNIYGAIMVGYPRYRYKRLIPRKEREVRRI